MVSLVLATPATPPPLEQPVVNPSIEMTWTSWDGTVWDLMSGRQGVALQKGVRGLNMPPVAHYSQTSAGIHGSRRTGWVAKDREIYWPTLIYKPTGDPTWSELDSRFWRSMHPGRPGTWSVRGAAANSELRTLSCTYESDNGHAMGSVPSVRGWETYGIYLSAEKPFWLGPRIIGNWNPKSPSSFFGNGGPPFYISSGSSRDSATVTNPGDLDAWPEWTVIGPTPSTTIGLNDRLITVPFDIPEGKALRIDTDPLRQTVMFGDWVDNSDGGVLRNAVDRFVDMGRIEFTPVPSGKDLPLRIEFGASNPAAGVRMRLTPRYFRAW